jgi:hypothetical protein
MILIALVAFLIGLNAGCGDSATGSGQPKLQGPPDPRIKGPASVGGDATPKPKPTR